MAKGVKVSKNAQRSGVQALKSRWDGDIVMRSIFQEGKLLHMAVCEKTGNMARKPHQLM